MATIAGNRIGVSVDEISKALRSSFVLHRANFPVHHHFPGDFLIRSRSRDDRARVVAGSLRTPRFRLLFSPWCHLTGGETITARFRVRISIRGIPDHAWSRSSVEYLLTPFCLIEDLAPETSSGQDMSLFRLFAWTANPDNIPCSSELLLPTRDGVDHRADPDRVSRFARPLIRYPISIHVHEMEDYRFPSPSPPSLADPDGDANSDRGSPPVPGLAAMSIPPPARQRCRCSTPPAVALASVGGRSRTADGMACWARTHPSPLLLPGSRLPFA